MRREMDLRFAAVEERFNGIDEHLDTIETTVSGLAGMIALVYGEQWRSRNGSKRRKGRFRQNSTSRQDHFLYLPFGCRHENARPSG